MPAPLAPSTSERPASRRRLLAAVGTAATAGLAGCTGSVPGTVPDDVPTEPIEQSDERVAWQFPPADDIGYVALSLEGPVPIGEDAPPMRFALNATTGLENDFELDRFRARLRVPREYAAEHGPPTVLVEPPGGGQTFHAYTDYRAGQRETVIELRDIDTEGTVLVPFRLAPGVWPFPDALGADLAVRAVEPGAFGRTVRASAQGWLAWA